MWARHRCNADDRSAGPFVVGVHQKGEIGFDPRASRSPEHKRAMLETAMSVRGLFETHLTVADLSRSVAFYRDVVALPVALEVPERGAADRLIAARLLEDDHGVLRPTPLAEATFRAAPEPRYLRWTA